MKSNATKKLLTLCIIHQNSKVLLGMKKRGFGVGRWNGFGGKVETGETIESAMERELEEEAGITANNLKKVGILEFEWEGDPEISQVHIFRSDSFSGEPTESEEMKPEWFEIDEIPFEKMWPDDIHWMLLFLGGKKFKGSFLFGKADSILHKELSKTESL